MERYRVDSPYFKYNKLEVIPAGFFKGITIELDNVPQVVSKKKAILKDDNGMERTLKVSGNPYDHPWVEIEGVKYYPMGKFSGVERFFVFLPLALMFIGGFIGGGLGGFASWTNSNLMREFKDSHFIKYGLCLVSTFVASVSWYLCFVLLNSHMVANH